MQTAVGVVHISRGVTLLGSRGQQGCAKDHYQHEDWKTSEDSFSHDRFRLSTLPSMLDTVSTARGSGWVNQSDSKSVGNTHPLPWAVLTSSKCDYYFSGAASDPLRTGRGGESPSCVWARIRSSAHCGCAAKNRAAIELVTGSSRHCK